MIDDLQTNAPDTDYFFLGDGRIMAAIQWSRSPTLSPYGLILYDPERMSRKNGALLFHPELGLSRTMLTVIVDGVRHAPRHEDLRAAWDFTDGPSVVVRWKAGDLEVTERFSVQKTTSNLLRDVTVSPAGERRVEIEAALYANPLLFDEFGVRAGSGLYASGYSSLTLHSVPRGRSFERFLTVGVAQSTPAIAVTFIYMIEAVGTHEFSLYPADTIFMDRQDGPWSEAWPDPGASPPSPGRPDETALPWRIGQTYRIARASLRGCVSQLGKFDASIWQYDYEWGMDAAMVAAAAASSGMFDLARRVLMNILRRLSNAEGMIAEAGRFRGGEMAELNGNGAVLDALWHYWRWSGDETLLQAQWRRIVAIADYPLRPEFGHPSGLLKTRRDFWERYPWMGVGEGFELAHQTFCAVGLARAAEIASALGKADEAARWGDAAARIGDAMLHHPQFSLVENGRFIRRRLIDGSPQKSMSPDPAYHDPNYASYIPPMPDDLAARPCEPDVAEALPIVYGLVDPASDLALRTLEELRALWSPNGTGGYARYNTASDPDSPGPWPFATAFMAAAEIEGGLDDRARGTIGWLIDAAGAGGSWCEYYGERPPSYPPVGIIVWGWAQYILLVVRHIIGVRVEGNRIVIAPRMTGLDHTLHFGAHTIRIAIRGSEAALLDGEPLPLRDGAAHLALPLTSDHLLEFR